MERKGRTQKSIVAKPLLRWLLLWFSFLIFLLHIIIALHLYTRTRFTVAPLVEIYAGSEVAVGLFPGYPDHFRPPRSFSGILKLNLWHFFAIPFFSFVFIHLLLAVWRNRLLSILSWLYWIVGILLVLAPFLFLLDACLGVYFYYTIFAVFELLGLSLSVLLAWGLAVVNRIDVMI